MVTKKVLETALLGFDLIFAGQQVEELIIAGVVRRRLPAFVRSSIRERDLSAGHHAAC
ncbi:MAG TPA: hypothetical protein VH325_16045 [Bryobacteraceae bacterium]|nr:hypothetical protein [Bryobacteraceae bacterium]